MAREVKWTLNNLPKGVCGEISLMKPEIIEEVRAFHRSFPQYAVTPLVKLDGMAARMGLEAVCVKDERHRFGLNAFKVLGGSYAIAKVIAQKLGKPFSEMTYGYLKSEDFRREFGQATFFTATDGNHGRGVAWAANQLGQKAVVHMPKGTRPSRFENIQKENAQVSIEDCNYDGCVRIAAKEAAEAENGVLVQDTAWDGYTEIPGFIMQGYGTLAAEALEQLAIYGIERPDAVILQAGVGALAGAIAAYLVQMYPDCPPKIIVAESDQADCFYQSALRGDGGAVAVGGDLDTIMAGLACGEVNITCWAILRRYASAFCACSDAVAARGMRMMAAPVKGDAPICSGESGAIGMGLLDAIMTDPDCAALKAALGLCRTSSVLLISTEGDTDLERYERIVWDGKTR